MKGSELKAIRLRLGMTQAEMAEALGLSDRGHVSYMESGRIDITGPGEAVIRNLAKRGRVTPPKRFKAADVRRIRERLGWTTLQMAEALHLNDDCQVTHLETGRTRVNWAKAALLAELAAKIPKKSASSS